MLAFFIDGALRVIRPLADRFDLSAIVFAQIKTPRFATQFFIIAFFACIFALARTSPRFWCRYLCPAGAFLSLFNKVAVLRRFLPAKKFGLCEFGPTEKDQLDCISCDRCRYEVVPPAEPARLTHADDMRTSLLCRTLVISVLVVAVLISAMSIDRLVTVLPAYEDYTASSIASPGQPRDVDLQRIEDLIRQNKLSDREAEFYKKLDQPPVN